MSRRSTGSAWRQRRAGSSYEREIESLVGIIAEARSMLEVDDVWHLFVVFPPFGAL